MMAQPDNVTELLSAPTKAFFDYWQRLATAQRPPKKSAINPAAIKSLIPRLVIYERKDPSVFQIRLMGTSTVQRVGVDLTGRNLLDFFAYAAKDEAQHDLNRIVDEPCGQLLMVKDRFTSGREAFVEIVRLPLTDDTGETRFIIGCTEMKKTTGFDSRERDKPELIAEKLKGCFFDLTGMVHHDTVWENASPSAPNEV